LEAATTEGRTAFAPPVLPRRYYLGVNGHCALSTNHLQKRGNANPHILVDHITPYQIPNALQPRVTSLHGHLIQQRSEAQARSHEHHETVSVVVILATNLLPSYKGMVRSDMSKPALIIFSLQEYTQQNPLSKF
jgi:hypothetical protein